jgi:hypothetical protein
VLPRREAEGSSPWKIHTFTPIVPKVVLAVDVA